jgi:rod shape-determining protein MreC
MIRVWSVTAVTPIAKVLEVVRRNTIGLVEDYFVLINVREQNRHLNAELGRLKMENQFLKTELQTADRARALQAFQTRTPSRTLAARIIGTGTGTNSRVVFVDQGSRAGVMRGMAVVTPDGIVGKVLASYPTASQVLLITDGSFAAGVISDKNRVHGTVKGLGQSKCHVDYIQNEEKVEVGEMFYTSGDDRVFPKGMPVGKVTVVRPGKTFKEIYIVPTGFQHGLEEVLIVVEGVHQPIPDSTVESAPGIHILPAPAAPGPLSSALPAPGPGHAPTDAAAAAQPGNANPMMTDADRIRDRYKRLGEAQKHVFGTGLPGSRPPDFNLDLKKAPPAATTPAKPAQTPPAQPPPVQPGAASAKTVLQSPPAEPAKRPVDSAKPPVDPAPAVTTPKPITPAAPKAQPSNGGAAPQTLTTPAVKPPPPKPKPVAPTEETPDPR